MDGNLSGEESDIDWDTEDELEIQGPPSPPVPPVEEPETGNGDMNWNSDDDLEIEAMPLYMPPPSSPPEQKPKILNGEASTSTAPSNYMLIKRFVSMGFSEELVTKAIKENGEEASDDVITDFLLTYNAIESSPQNQQTRAISDPSLSESDGENIDFDYFSDSDSWPGTEENGTSLNDEEKRVKSLEKMGYTKEESELALQRCGLEASLSELTDFICAAQLARADDVNWQEDVKPNVHRNGILKKRKLCEYERKKEKKRQQVEGVELIRLPKPMIGFGIPKELTPRDEIIPIKHNRILPEHIRGPPYFYYENVALAPKGVWDTISRSLYDIEPEFVDSKYFCAAARKRGYIHNLPITGRRPLLPFPPRTIHEALPLTKRWWPKWDTRTKLNCLQTAIGSAKLTDKIRKAVEGHDVPPVAAQKFVIEQCRKWNLVWVGPNKVAPLECDEFELLLGFPKNHTRGGGISRTDRYKSLGNSFQVDTVAYHLSVLKEIFPKGINLLSLFSGIGGAEVALHRLGVPLKNVVSVEKSEQNRDIVRSWWEQTNQRGTLTHYDDVQMLNKETLEHHIRNFGGFDLVIGGSPCNNLAGSNRVSRDGLEGEHSSLFYHYPRILDLVRSIMNGVNR